MTTSPLYLDISILQSVPPSNMNRDDAGAPKNAHFGGALRARVSSQAWKRATRLHFACSVPEQERATRTKRIAQLLAERIGAGHPELDSEAARRLATTLLAPLKITPSKKKTEETSYLLFFGKAQLDRIAGALSGRASELAALDDDTLAKELAAVTDVKGELTSQHPAEVALFGRMVADLAGMNVDASVQVAHALSTHAVKSEYDYYTAVDDENPSEETGAGMIGDIGFNSSTLYRYATVGLEQLLDNLSDHDSDDAEGARRSAERTAEVAAGFVESFVRSMPAGYQNSFAHRTLPHLVWVTLRRDQPVNLVSAFENPVWGTRGVAEASVARLADEARSVADVWGSVPAWSAGAYGRFSEEVQEKATSAFGPSVPFTQLTESLRSVITEHVKEEK